MSNISACKTTIWQCRNKRQVLVYDLWEYGSVSNNKLQSMEKARKEKDGKHGLTSGAKKRMTRALNNLSVIAKKSWKINPETQKVQPHQLTFLTLTIASSEIVTGKRGYDELLEPFLRWLGRYATTDTGKGVKHWVYKVERQKRGQLHYHLFFPDMIAIREVRKKWNALQKAAGLLDAYAEKHGTFNVPNGVDVVSWENKKADISTYMLKEFNKKEQNPVDLDTRIWGCSEGLEEPYYSFDMRRRHRRRLLVLKRKKLVKVYNGDHFSMMVFAPGVVPIELLLTAQERQQFEERLLVIKGEVVRIQPPVLSVAYVPYEKNDPPGWVPLQIDFDFSSS